MATAPGSITATRTSNTSISVSWGQGFAQVAGTVTYDLEVQTNFGSFSRALTATFSRSASFNLTAGNSYRFKVRSRETRPGFATRLSTFTTSSRVYLPPPTPGTPGLTRQADLASIRVSWGGSNGATGYIIERSRDNSPTWEFQGSTTGTAITASGLVRGSSYRFRVRASGLGGTSAFSTSGSLRLRPFQPGSMSASLSGATSIRVTFPASNGASGYNIDRSENGGGYSRITNNTSSRDINYGGLNRGSTYQFRVFAINSGGSSPTARESNSVQVPFPPPSTPPSATATKTKRDVRITFGASSAPSGTSILNYEIEIRADGGSYGSRRTDNGSGETYSNLNPGSTYQGRVRAIGQGGASDWRESNTVTISPPPTVPSNILRTRSGRDVFVELGTSTAASDVTISGYTIQRRESFNNGATWGAWGDQRSFTTTDRTTTYTNLVAETTQQFRGRAESDFNSSDWRTSETLFIPGIPDPPSQVFAFREGAAVFVVIAAPVSDGGAPVLTYTIEKRISDDSEQTWSEWAVPVTIPFAQPSYLYDDLELQKTYQFRALATNSEGNSESFTESEPVYLPAIMRIYDGNEFRLPGNYKRYSEEVGDWVGLRISRRYFNGQWVELE